MLSKIQEIRQKAKGLSLLYAEDDVQLREVMHSYLSKLFEDVRVASNGEEGLKAFKQRPADIVLSDILMPYMNGIEMIRAIKKINPKQHSIILSAYTESQYFMEAISLGVSSYIIKPIEYTQINEVLYEIVSRIYSEKEVDLYQHNLEKLVAQKVQEYQELKQERVADYETILLALINMIERRDSYTAGHSQRVANYSKMLATALGFSSEDCELVYRAGILHDIGKIATPDAILLNPSNLNDLEYSLIKEHVSAGVDILSHIPYFEPLIHIIISHHERYDGKGYPQGLAGDAIHPLARVMIVADAFDAMTTNRIYKHKKSVQEAFDELQACTQSQFHPEVVKAALEVFKDIKIQTNISQLPTTTLEEERFAYFYRDRVTHLHNQDYLSIVLVKNAYNSFYHTLRIISLHNFKAYNDTFGWEAGDVFLRKIAHVLNALYPRTLAFRIHANDFVFLSQTPLDPQDEINHVISHVAMHAVALSILDVDLDTVSLDSVKTLEQFMHKQ
ncbi:MAG: response regulator [Sulfurospirillum sp.]|nr:response regulator [Sulfurospirillum sp.]